MRSSVQRTTRLALALLWAFYLDFAFVVVVVVHIVVVVVAVVRIVVIDAESRALFYCCHCER